MDIKEILQTIESAERQRDSGNNNDRADFLLRLATAKSLAVIAQAAEKWMEQGKVKAFAIDQRVVCHDAHGKVVEIGKNPTPFHVVFDGGARAWASGDNLEPDPTPEAPIGYVDDDPRYPIYPGDLTPDRPFKVGGPVIWAGEYAGKIIEISDESTPAKYHVKLNCNDDLWTTAANLTLDGAQMTAAEIAEDPRL